MGNELSVENAIINVEVASVMNAYGIFSNVKTAAIENVIVNGNYSSCGNFNEATGRTSINNSEFYTTYEADGFSAPTIKYQGELEIRNSKITRVNVGIQFNRSWPTPDKVEGLTYDESVIFYNINSNGYPDITYKGYIGN